MKKKLLVLAGLLLCAAVSATGTMAYFSADAQAHNVITTGNVKIEIQEWANSDKTEEFRNLDGIMPNTSVTKIAEVKNTGEADAWIRVKVTKEIKLTGEGTPDLSLVKLDLNTGDWEQNDDGYLYYKRIVEPEGVTAPIFTTVTFDKTMGNEYQNATATVTVEANAVQSANNAGRTGWPESKS